VRVAALYDIHGNLPALEAVLDEVAAAGAEVLLIGGDIVSGPLPVDTLAALEAAPLPVRMVRGNADRELALPPGTADVDRFWTGLRDFCVARLGPERVRRLAGLPTTVSLDVDGLGPTLFGHGSPRSDEEIVTRRTPPERLRPMLAGVAERTVALGHTHVQWDRTVDGVRIVNPGSVGMPYEDTPGARWALLGPDVELRTTSYDVESAAARLRAGGLPGVEEWIESFLLHPTGAEEATTHFERAATAADAPG
jgi:predicted phosphodiesterase